MPLLSSMSSAEALLRELRARFRLAWRLGPDVIIVGGAVRDLLLGRRPGDLDVVVTDAVDAAAQLAREANGRFVTLGRAEWSSFRVVAGGEEIDFTELPPAGLEKDLSRRDFTVNAMALQTGRNVIIDPFEGQRDLQSSTLRMIDRANFRADPLRILRGVRFAAELGFTIEPLTFAAMREHSPLVTKLAPERVRYELDLMIRSPSPFQALRLLRDLDLHDALFGEVIPPAVTELVDGKLGDTITSFAVLFHGLESRKLAEVLKRWRWSRDESAQLRTLLGIYSARHRVGPALDDWRVELHRAGQTTAKRLLALLETTGDQPLHSLVAKACENAIFDLRPLLTGHDIRAVTGLEPGPELGRVKEALMEAQLRGEVADLESATRFVREKKGRSS